MILSRRKKRLTEMEIQEGLRLLVQRTRDELLKQEKVFGHLESYDPVEFVKCRSQTCGNKSIIVIGIYENGVVLMCSRCLKAMYFTDKQFLDNKMDLLESQGLEVNK